MGVGGEVVGPGISAPSTGGGGGGGTVTGVSVATANGLAGTVANPTTTPVITLTTTVTGILAGNGTTISAATVTGTGGTVVESVSPALTGTPTAPTATGGTNTTQIATTAFVAAAVAGLGSGTVTSASVVSANGFAGTVANASTTPAITISTTVTGLLKGNGTAISAATAGTDYPATGVITGGSAGSGTAVPVITYNANGQLTTVTTSATVGTVAATDTSIVVGGTATAPTIATGTLDVIATQHAPAANWSNNSHKITSLSNGSAASDAAAFGQIPTTALASYTYSSVTADPNPAVVGTYYHVVLASTGNFTLPSTSLANGNWIMVKNRSATTTMNIVGTVDGNASFTVGPGLAVTFVYNGTDWDAN